MIKFNIPPYIGQEEENIINAIKNNKKIAGDGPYTKKCSEWMENRFHADKVLLTTSGSSALDMAALLVDILPDDEVIMPSYTFVSTANSFVLRGAKIVFIDIRPDTLNIDEKLIEEAVTNKTKAIIPVHYGGVSCEMNKINEIAEKYNLFVIEDAAQGVMASYNNKALGTIGAIGCYSFHETKNYSMGEGGALILNKNKFIEKAEIIREKGTNRSRFFRGEIDKYSWVNYGSSFLPSDINAAYLYPQLINADLINNSRLNCWELYYKSLSELSEKIELPFIPEGCNHNAHMFYIKVKDLKERTELISSLKSNDIYSVFHYVPLHSSEAGRKYGRFHGQDKYTTIESERLLRLPMYYGLKNEEIHYVCEKIKEFYK